MDSKEFETIAPLLRAKSLQVSRKMGLAADDADDVAQDVLLKLWQMRSELGASHPPEALVVVATRHRAIDLFRAAKHIAYEDALDVTSRICQETPIDALEYAETDRWLRNKIRALPDKEHAVLMMRQVERREYCEIARLLGIEEASARVLLARARKKLLQQFKQYSQ